MNTDEQATIGVIVGRFQIPQLTPGHREILDYVLAQGHAMNILVLGTPPKDVRSTKNNPIPYATRKRMIEDAYPGRFEILYIQDTRTDKEWSDALDKLILNVTNGHTNVVLYGSRDSFIERYCGNFKCHAYQQRVMFSGTTARKNLGSLIGTTPDFGYGCVYATQNRYDSVYMAVDCAIFTDPKRTHLYMGRKDGSSLLRFPGGFVDPSDASLEAAAYREAREETNLVCDRAKYAGSFQIDDWRYRGEVERIMSTLFMMRPVDGSSPAAGDDLSELHLVALQEVNIEDIVPEHRKMFASLRSLVNAFNNLGKRTN